MKVRLKNNIGIVKECKIGFSWTNFFFGAFTPAFRGDWKYCGIMVLCAFFTFGISWLVFPFLYNKLYINDLLKKGYTPASESDRKLLVFKGFIADDLIIEG